MSVKLYVDETLWGSSIKQASAVWVEGRPGFWEYVEMMYLRGGGRVEDVTL